MSNLDTDRAFFTFQLSHFFSEMDSQDPKDLVKDYARVFQLSHFFSEMDSSDGGLACIFRPHVSIEPLLFRNG